MKKNFFIQRLYRNNFNNRFWRRRLAPAFESACIAQLVQVVLLRQRLRLIQIQDASLPNSRLLKLFRYSKKGHRKLVKDNFITGLLHEMVHFKHWVTNYQATAIRGCTPSSNPDMHTQEEELTITGSIVGSSEVEPCNENAILNELKLPIKIDHLGYSQDSPVKAIKSMIYARTIESLKKKLASTESKNEVMAKADEILLSAVECMLSQGFSSNFTEYLTIIEFLINQGFKSDQALTYLLGAKNQDFLIAKLVGTLGCKIEEPLLIRDNKKDRKDLVLRKEYLEIIQQLINTGCKSDGALKYAVKQVKKIEDPIVRKEYLQIIQRLIDAKCKSNEALELVAKYANEESDPIRHKEWLGFIVQLFQEGYKSNTFLKNMINIIKLSNDPNSAKELTGLIKPLMDEFLATTESRLQEEFCQYMQLLIDIDYSPLALELFKSSLIAGHDTEFLNEKSEELQLHIEKIHHFIEKKLAGKIYKRK